MVARVTGMAISTVRKGRDEVRTGARREDVVKVRRAGGGRRAHEVVFPELWPALESLVDPVTRGDPESPLRWTCKSTHVLSTEMFRQHGIRVSDKTVARCRPREPRVARGSFPNQQRNVMHVSFHVRSRKPAALLALEQINVVVRELRSRSPSMGCSTSRATRSSASMRG